VRIDKIDLVSAFHTDTGAPFKLGSSLTEIADKNRAQITSLTVPAAAPPNMPRCMLQSQQSVILVTLDRVQLSVVPPDHIRDSLDEVIVYLNAEKERLLSPLTSHSWMNEEWCGVVITAVFPLSLSSASSAAAKAAAHLTSFPLDADGDLKTFQLQIGTNVEGYYRSFTIAGYELRTAEFQMEIMPGPNFIELNEENSTVEETGIQFSVDINNRPRAGRPKNSVAIVEVVDEAKKAITDFVSKLNLEGISS
jgi:hypothetical protein